MTPKCSVFASIADLGNFSEVVRPPLFVKNFSVLQQILLCTDKTNGYSIIFIADMPSTIHPALTCCNISLHFESILLEIK